MKKRIIWLVVSVLMVLSLVLASCAPKVTEEKEVVTEEKKVVTEEKKVVTEEKKVVAKEEALLPYQKVTPKYGGTMNLVREADPTSFEQKGFRACMPFSYHQTNEVLLAFDMKRGLGGTGEWMYGYPFPTVLEYLTGHLAESWETDLTNNRFIFHIRKGVRFWDKPPANGREMTAEDVLFSLRRVWGDPNSYAYRTLAGLRDMKNVASSIYLDPDDPWAVVVEANPEYLALAFEGATQNIYIVPKEVGETEIMKKWQDAIGTGAFILTDYVSGSSLTFQRNPNYWKKDQLYPQNQLPYVDVLKFLIMPDWASRLAALQTGKIESLDDVFREQAEVLWRYNPELQYMKYFVPSSGTGSGMLMRHDVKPFDDVRVRRAMMMAIDHPEIVRDYYKGDAELFYFPVVPTADMMYMYKPLEEMPEVVQKMYGYHPDEAARLLDEAGYPGPKRFTTSVTAWSEVQIDVASLVAAYWARVGVTLEIDIRESAVFSSMTRSYTFPHGSMNGQTSIEAFKFCTTAVGASRAAGAINKDYIQEALKGISANFFNRAEQGRISKEVMVKMNEDAVVISLPHAYEYRFWQPWLKGYYGEYNSGSYLHSDGFARYAWIDQELKQQITGRR